MEQQELISKLEEILGVLEDIPEEGANKEINDSIDDAISSLQDLTSDLKREANESQ